MNIEAQLRSILEGTYIEETVLTRSEADELYDLKDKVKVAKDKLLFVRNPQDKHNRQMEIEKMEEQLHALRSKAFTRD